MSALEARYRWLLSAYPAGYRRDRGGEMLDTLMEAAGEGRSWPSARDARALILGGLRVRAWHDQRQGAAASVRAAVLLAMVLTLITRSTVALGWAYAFPARPSLAYLTLGLLTVAAAAGAWFGHRAVVAVTALATAGLWVNQPRYVAGPGRGAEPALALVVLAILVIRRERLPRQWLWLAGPVFAGYLLPALFPVNGLLHTTADLALFAGFGATIVWSLVDARPIVAAALWLALIIDAGSIDQFAGPGPHMLWEHWLPAIIATGIAIAALMRLRRQAIP